MAAYDPQAFFKEIAAANPNVVVPTEYMTIEDAGRRSHALSSEVFAHWDRLRSLVDAYEPVIQKRWKKRNFKQREAVLRIVMPDISASHNVAIRLFNPGAMGRNRKPRRDQYLLPYVNVEDLCKDFTHLLGLIHHRVASPPADFVGFDEEQMHCGIYFKEVERPFCNGCGIIMYGDRKEYGKIIKWEDVDKYGDNGWDKMMRQDAPAPADALTILEAQEKLLKLLVAIAEYFLQDHDTKPEFLTTVPPATDALLTTGPSQTLETGVMQWTSLSKTHRQQPFLAPPEFSVSKLREAAVARKEQALDHVWLMRTDPNFFWQMLKSIDQHRPEQILNEKKKPHPVLNTPLYYDRLAGRVFFETYSEALHWTLIAEEVELLETLRNKTTVEIGRPLESEYEKALSSFHLLVYKCLQLRLRELHEVVMANPLFRHLYQRLPTDPKRPSIIRASMKHNYLDLYEKDRLLWTLIVMSDEQHNWAFSLDNLLDEIDYICEKSKTESSRISQYLYDKIGEVATLNEMLIALKYHRPRYLPPPTHVETNQEILSDLWNDSDDIGKTLEAPGGRWAPLRLLRESTNIEKGKLGKFIVPMDKFRPDFSKVKNRSERELKEQELLQSLGGFWKSVDAVAALDKGGQISEMVEVLTQLVREPEVTEGPEDKAVLETRGRVILPEVEALKLTPVSTTIRPENENEALPETIQRTKEKVKTRGEANLLAQSSGSDGVLPAAGPAESKKEKIALSARATKFLTTAIPSLQPLSDSPNSKSQSPVFDWKDFLNSMYELGFSAEKKRGSAWMFSYGERSFSAHEPHPDRKMDFGIVRFLGKRLQRRFGWSVDDFVVS